MKSAIPTRVLSAYDLARVETVSQIASGLIHQTYKIAADKGTFILQRLHPMLATEEIADDFFVVTEYLNANGFPAPSCALTKRGEVLANDGTHYWRMQTCLPGRTFERVPSLAHVREAGGMYADLHRTLDGLAYRFRSRLKLHETRKIFRAFEQIVRRHEKKILSENAKPEITFIKTQLPKFFLPENLPRRVIHGDPKISNILFDRKGCAVGVVDLDTCNRHTVLADLGDAFRSWCADKKEDDRCRFRTDVFRAGWSAYKRRANGFLTSREIKLVPRAIACITLELACRFLTDYFNDSYFGWDPKRYPSRRAHNLARCRGQLSLFKNFQTKQVTP